MKKYILLALSAFLFTSGSVSAHQPIIAEGTRTEVTQPEISKAYYDELKGTEHVYRISATQPFDLYVNVLVPDIEGQQKDFRITLQMEGTGKPFATLEGTAFKWSPLFEPYGYDSYWKGPEYRAQMGSGNYEIIVSASNGVGKYTLAIGEKESFGLGETLQTLEVLPQIKKDFFHKSPITLVQSPIGYGTLIIVFLLSLLVGYNVRRFVVRYMKKSSVNVTKKGRLIRTLVGAGLILLAISTSWNLLIMLIGSLVLFEALSGWCVFYALFERKPNGTKPDGKDDFDDEEDEMMENEEERSPLV